MEKQREVLTAKQAADYLQVNRETVYRYIRQGKLVASRLGRYYRIPKRSLELFLWSTRSRDDITLREYTGAEVLGFLERDALDEEAQEVAQRFLKEHRQCPEWQLTATPSSFLTLLALSPPPAPRKAAPAFLVPLPSAL